MPLYPLGQQFASNPGITMPAPSGDTTGATDTPALQAAINALPIRTTAVFQPGTYYINAALNLPGFRAYTGSGYGYGQAGTTIKQAAGANITAAGGVSALLVPSAWVANQNTVDNPISITNLNLDGTKASNTATACGIILYNFWSLIQGVQVVNAPVDGIRLTDTTANGTTVAINTASENRIDRVRVDSPAASGLRQVCSNNISNTDGFLTDSIFATIGVNGIVMDRGAGWLIRGNHLYGIQQNAIALGACFATRVVDNYIEDFGIQSTAAAFYEGIGLTQLSGRGSVVSGNFVGCTEPSSGVGAYQYYALTAGSAQTDADINLLGNHAQAPAVPSTKGQGLVAQVNGGGVLFLRADTNRLDGMNTQTFLGTSVVLYAQDSQLKQHRLVGSTATAFNDAAAGTTPPSPVLTGSDVDGKVTVGTGTATTTGLFVGIAYATSYVSAPAVTVTPGNAVTAALGLYVVSGVNGFDIGVTTAPAINQANTTYIYYYNIQS